MVAMQCGWDQVNITLNVSHSILWMYLFPVLVVGGGGAEAPNFFVAAIVHVQRVYTLF